LLPLQSVRRILCATLVLFSVACDLPMERTTDALPTPSEKRSAFPPPAAVSVITSLAGPESVLHDSQQDVYFISNLNGGLLDVDGNGFISRVDPHSMAVNLRWIEGGKNGVKLDAPKGMTIVGETLFVSDITAVRRFNRRTGAAEGEIALPGATLINDLTTDGTNVYASDTGVKPASGIQFIPTGTDAIWKIRGDRAEKIASGTDLDQPNGIDFHGGALWVVSFRGNRLYRLGGAGKESERELPRGQLDGLVHLEDGTPVVSSWIGTAIYRGNGERFTPMLTAVTTPADIGLDSKRKRLLVPRSALNQVTIHAITDKGRD
jgi:hypothetical protein